MSISSLSVSESDDRNIDSPTKVDDHVQALLGHLSQNHARAASPTASSPSSDNAVVHQPLENPSAGHLLQMIRDSANQILECTGGRTVSEPTPGTMSFSADDQRQVLNITRMSDDIVRNLAHMLTLRTGAQPLPHGDGNGDGDDDDAEMHNPDKLGHPHGHELSLVIDPLPVLPTRLAPRRTHSRRTSRLCCRDCRRHATPKWRPGPHGPATLCNVCGLLYARRMGIIDGLHDN